MGMTYQNQMAMSLSPGSGYVDPRSGESIIDRMRGNGIAMPGGGAGGAGAGGGNARVDAARDSMYGLAKSRLSDQQKDPVDALIQKQLMDRAGGNGLPYDATTQNAMLVGQANQAHAAEMAQAGRIRGNPNDPSVRAARSELMANRQGSMQDARLNIAQNANVSNYNAQMGALNQLNGFNSGRQQRLTGASNYLGGLYGQEYATTPSGGGGGSRQFILPGGGGGGGGGGSSGGGGAGSGPFGDDPFFSAAGPFGTGNKPQTGMITGTARLQTPEMQAYNRRVNPSLYGGPTADQRDTAAGIVRPDDQVRSRYGY